MPKTIHVLTSLFGFAVAATMAHADSITIANNGGTPAAAQRKVFDEPFTAKTGVQVLQDDAGYKELAKIRSQVETKNLLWDASVTVSIREAEMCEEGMIEKIDWSKYFDPKDFAAIGGFGKCGIPYVGSPGALAYDADKLTGDKAPKTWQDFWNVEKFPGKRGLVNQPDETLEIALIADGVAPKDVARVLIAPGGVDRAFAKLEKLKPHVRWWGSGAESMQLLLNGEVTMTYAYQGRVYTANRSNNRNLKMVWEAGYVSSPIYYVVVKGTPNLKNTVEWIKSTVTPERQAAYSEFMGMQPANAKAYALLPKGGFLNAPSEHLDKGMIQIGEKYLNFYLDNGDTLRQRFAAFIAK